MSLTARVKAIQGHLDGLHQVELDRRLDELLADPKYDDPRRLTRHQHKVFSQSGEDGILAEIFRRIGVTNRFFVECAPGNGIENNTLYLLTLGWKGCWIEADSKNAKAIRLNLARKIEDKSLSFQQERVTADNIESLFARASVPSEFDLLSVDIDGNDYWVWQKIERYKPRVVLIEYNPTFPPDCDWVMEYDPNAAWDGSCKFGASLLALERLGVQKGYNLVGCTLTGANAFFVREELLRDRFLNPFTAENHYEPPRYYLTLRRAGHRRAPAWGRVGPSRMTGEAL
ncbi:MAG: hypothetical protein ACRD06_07075 [Terriglobia bacterium]